MKRVVIIISQSETTAKGSGMVNVTTSKVVGLNDLNF